MQRLLIADDSSVIRKVGKRILNGLGFMVAEAGTAAEILHLCEIRLPDVLIIDSAIEGALDAIAGVRAMEGGADVRIYFCLVKADLRHMMVGRRAGVDDFLLKPFDRALLEKTFGNMAAAA